MKQLNLSNAKEMIAAIAGENYSSRKLAKAIRTSPDKPGMLLTCMFGLGIELAGEDQRLTQLRKGFYRQFAPEIAALFQFLHTAAGYHKLTVNDADQFILSTLRLLDNGAISTPSIRNLARVIKATCRIPYTEGTIRNKLNDYRID
ncbi:MAG: hypothetical protein LUD74_04370 [Tannerellaceae bacterium]|nr:hypothetical protein [Tannerellaceae bacterium]